ncbi:UNVERIFIED_ORG: ribulose-bisphosphate carboxylase large chain [Rhizobium etli]|uniref:ribulose-bisphosphate carboxylase large subunit family protein n=1 Tax=Rhizobium sp. Kim5 TaxID=2020311 RepID=UPI000A2A376B|nr:ribulose-bisphosphate carboxylase large subunit family protein [Rhizobium sp. Kim5]ARQ62208.1 ribulose bisphosphate carboxylase large subunit protein [Rhizobium sp. Kim5]
MTNPKRLEADYILETYLPPEKAAEIIAGEQSSGTFVAVPGETPELKALAAAKVESLETISTYSGVPSLEGRYPANGTMVLHRVKMTLSWPLATVGTSLPNLLATVAGNLFELACVSGLRIVDIRLPPSFFQKYKGPAFGIAGTRRLTDVQTGPIIGTIVKPSVGMTGEQTAFLVQELVNGGIDFIKDDELQSDSSVCPFDDRVDHVMRVINEAADRTGKKTMYAFNLTGDMDEMRRRHDKLVSVGATCLMVSLNSVGMAGFIDLRSFSQLPIHAHRNGWGYLTRHQSLGWSYVAWQKIWRLAGADHMHVNGLDNKFSEDNESVLRSARGCLTPMSDDKPCLVMPVFSSGQSVHQAHSTYVGLQSDDLIVTAGGGIMAHPKGPAAGVQALRDAYQAATAGESLESAARSSDELRLAMEMRP